MTYYYKQTLLYIYAHIVPYTYKPNVNGLKTPAFLANLLSRQGSRPSDTHYPRYSSPVALRSRDLAALEQP
jgi:hypothetical protein